MGDLFILSSVSTIKRYSSSIDMTLPIRSDLRDSNHMCSLGLDISPTNFQDDFVRISTVEAIYIEY